MGKSNTMTTTEPANNEAPDRFPEMSPRGTKTGEQRQPEAGKVADPVHLPQHYSRWKVEPIYFIRENNLPFWMGNVIKYVMRAEFKNGIEDLKKARRYIDMEILKQQGNEDWAK